MQIGDKITQEEFDTLKKEYKSCRIGIGYYILDNDLEFKRTEDDMLELTSTFESRKNDQGVGPKIHRKESRMFKSYYDQREI